MSLVKERIVSELLDAFEALAMIIGTAERIEDDQVREETVELANNTRDCLIDLKDYVQYKDL